MASLAPASFQPVRHDRHGPAQQQWPPTSLAARCKLHTSSADVSCILPLVQRASPPHTHHSSSPAIKIARTGGQFRPPSISMIFGRSADVGPHVMPPLGGSSSRRRGTRTRPVDLGWRGVAVVLPTALPLLAPFAAQCPRTAPRRSRETRFGGRRGLLRDQNGLERRCSRSRMARRRESKSKESCLVRVHARGTTASSV